MPCERKYRNLGEKAFGEQKYVTADMLRQFCRNDAWLKREVERIEYLTPPAVRKRFNGIPVNKNESFGYMQGEDGVVHFDSTPTKIYRYDFNDMSVIDENKTTAFLQSFVSDDNSKVIKQYSIPNDVNCVKTVKRNTTRNYSPWTIRDKDGNIISDDMTCNEFWYIGYDRNRHYETRPNWLANMLNGEIPGITRCQTFKAKSNGKLTSITMNLKGGTNTGMPLVVEIRRTKMVDGVMVPVDSDEEHLAYETVKFTNTDPGAMSITFSHPCTVEKGKTYAIVLLSPLSHYTNCYWVGGWNKHCHADVYEDGNAFFSFNCGYTWIRYGKDTEEEENVAYHWGKYAPQDFAFQCHIEEVSENCTTKYDTSKPYYVYLKPIYSNPIKSVSISATDKGDTYGGKFKVVYEVSQTGKNGSWVEVEPNSTHNFSPDSVTGEYRNVLFVRAKLTTSDATDTPLLQSLTITLNTDLPKEMYVRTHRYYPQIDGILGASVWGRLYAPFTESDFTNCTVELISDMEIMEHFIITEPLKIINYSHIQGIDWSKIRNKSESNIKKYLTDNPSVVSLLMDNRIYVKGFFTKIKLPNSPAYPLISMYLQPDTGKTVYYGEGYDFTVNYGDDEITFYSEVLNSMPTGSITVTYNPILIDGLSSTDVGLQYSEDSEGNKVVEGQGLVLDYFQEEFTIGEEEIESRILKLKATPVDPIRKVVIVKNTDDLDDEDNIVLFEDVDYVMHYDTKELEFLVNNEDGVSSALELGDLINVVYTPNLNESSLCIGYHATRTRSNKDVSIEANWIEYKV